MAGFGLPDFEERIPCPHCGSTDCCGIKEFKSGPDLICSVTGRRVTERQLRESAEKHSLKKRENQANEAVQ